MSRAKPQAPALTVVSAWPDTMRLEQAAQYLCLGRDATRDLFDRGVLPGTSLNQKHLVFRRVALDAFLARQELDQMRERARLAQTLPCANDSHQPSRQRETPKPDLTRYESP